MSRFKLFIPLIIFMILSAFFWRGLSLDPTAMPSALIDKPLPAFTLGTVKSPGTQTNQKALLGEVALLNVWATWCISCRAEHPYLLELAEQGMKIYGVNYKDDVPAAKKWLQNLGDPYVYSVVDADGRLGVDLGVFGAPETYVLDKSGVIRFKHVGVLNERIWRDTIGPIVAALQK